MHFTYVALHGVAVWCTQYAPRWQFHVAPAMLALQVHHFGGYSKMHYKKLFTYTESQASTASLLDSVE